MLLAVESLRASGQSMLLAEQNLTLALRPVDRVHVLEPPPRAVRRKP